MFPILIFGLIALLTAAWFAWRAEPRVRGFIDLLSRTVLYATIAATAKCIMSTLFAAASVNPRVNGVPIEGMKPILVMRGLGESMSPLVLGFVLLTLTSLFTAIGQRRLDGRRSD